MGYMRHHAIVVTGYEPCTTPDMPAWLRRNYIAEAHQQAEEIFGEFVTPLTLASTNSYRSFLVPPDGSKEGWTESDAGDARRDEFIGFLNSLRYSDGSSPVTWAEVQYGDDSGVDVLVRTDSRGRLEVA